MKKNKIGTVLSLAAYTATIVHLINRYVSIHADYKDVLTTYQNQFYNGRLGRVYYTVKGTGAPLLLLHDVTSGGSGYEWSRIADELANEYTVYTLDLPGCGRSDKVNQIFTNFVFVQLVSNFIRDVIKTKTNVVATGYSASIVIMANIYREDMFDKVIFINPCNLRALAQPVSSRGKIYYNIIRTPILGTFIYHMHVSRENITTLFVNEYFNNPFKVDRDVVDAYYEAAHKGAYDCKFVYASQVSGFMNVNCLDAVKKLPADTLILRGETDNGAAAIDSLYVSMVPSLQRAVIKDTKHLPHIERPELVKGYIENFLE